MKPRALLALAVLAVAASMANAQTSGRFSVLTYNVAGLPQGISQSQPLFFMKKISPRLNDFDIVLTQEDFFYGEQLRSLARHPYYAGRSREGTLGDGLSRFSNFPLGEVAHVPWVACYGTLGHANDCLTPKGFSFAVHEITPGVKIHVYDLHMDAGGSKGDYDAKDRGMDQLIAYIAEHSAGQPLIVAGDWNLPGKREQAIAILQRLLDAHHLTDACRALECGEERIDRILFRGSDTLELNVVDYKVESELFSTKHGWPLSDHEAVSAVLEWRVK